MKKLLRALTYKEFIHILRDSRTIMLIIAMPVVLIFLLGFAMSTDLRNVNVAWMSDTQNDDIRRLIERIDNSDYFTVTERVQNMDQIMMLSRSGQIDAAIRFDETRGIQIIIDATNPNVGATAGIYLKNIIEDHLSGAATGVNSQSSVTPVVRMLYNPGMQSSFNFIPGILGLILIIICSMMTGVSIVREKEVGTMEVLLASPVKPMHIMLAKSIPYFCLSCIDMALILVLARFVMHVPMSGNLLLIIAISLLYTILSLSIGLFFSIVTQNQITSLLISVIVLLIPTMMLSDMMFPLQSMAPVFRGFSCIIPGRWYVEAMRKLMIEGLSFSYVWKDFVILAAMTLFVVGISIRKFKTRLQ